MIDLISFRSTQNIIEQEAVCQLVSLTNTKPAVDIEKLLEWLWDVVGGGKRGGQQK